MASPATPSRHPIPLAANPSPVSPNESRLRQTPTAGRATTPTNAQKSPQTGLRTPTVGDQNRFPFHNTLAVREIKSQPIFRKYVVYTSSYAPRLPLGSPQAAALESLHRQLSNLTLPITHPLPHSRLRAKELGACAAFSAQEYAAAAKAAGMRMTQSTFDFIDEVFRRTAAGIGIEATQVAVVKGIPPSSRWSLRYVGTPTVPTQREPRWSSQPLEQHRNEQKTSSTTGTNSGESSHSCGRIITAGAAGASASRSSHTELSSDEDYLESDIEESLSSTKTQTQDLTPKRNTRLLKATENHTNFRSKLRATASKGSRPKHPENAESTHIVYGNSLLERLASLSGDLTNALKAVSAQSDDNLDAYSSLLLNFDAELADLEDIYEDPRAQECDEIDRAERLSLSSQSSLFFDCETRSNEAHNQDEDDEAKRLQVIAPSRFLSLAATRDQNAVVRDETACSDTNENPSMHSLSPVRPTARRTSVALITPSGMAPRQPRATTRPVTPSTQITSTPLRTGESTALDKASTSRPTTPRPTTVRRTVSQAEAPKRVPSRPTTPRPTTPRATTPRPTTSRPTTPRPATSRPTTPRPTTPRPTTPRPTTPRPTMPQSTTQHSTPRPTATPGTTVPQTPKRAPSRPTTPRPTAPPHISSQASIPRPTTQQPTTPRSPAAQATTAQPPTPMGATVRKASTRPNTPRMSTRTGEQSISTPRDMTSPSQALPKSSRPSTPQVTPDRARTFTKVTTPRASVSTASGLQAQPNVSITTPSTRSRTPTPQRLHPSTSPDPRVTPLRSQTDMHTRGLSQGTLTTPLRQGVLTPRAPRTPSDGLASTSLSNGSLSGGRLLSDPHKQRPGMFERLLDHYCAGSPTLHTCANPVTNGVVGLFKTLDSAAKLLLLQAQQSVMRSDLEPGKRPNSLDSGAVDAAQETKTSAQTRVFRAKYALTSEEYKTACHDLSLVPASPSCREFVSDLVVNYMEFKHHIGFSFATHTHGTYPIFRYDVTIDVPCLPPETHASTSDASSASLSESKSDQAFTTALQMLGEGPHNQDSMSQQSQASSHRRSPTPSKPLVPPISARLLALASPHTRRLPEGVVPVPSALMWGPPPPAQSSSSSPQQQASSIRVVNLRYKAGAGPTANNSMDGADRQPGHANDPTESTRGVKTFGAN